MQNLLFHIILLFTAFSCYGIAAIAEDSNKIAIHLNNEGTLGGKAKAEFWRETGAPLNNHGFFYNGSLLDCSLLKTITLKTRLRIWNEELSAIDRYEYQFEPEIALSLRLKNLETNIRGGYINDLTIGSGLTVKDLSNSGAVVNVGWNGWTGSAGIFTRGYGILEDLYWVTLHTEFIPLELNALIINTQGTEMMDAFFGDRYYLSGYLLPNVKIKAPGGFLYAEYGFKLNRRSDVAGIIEESPARAHAGLIGFKTDCQRGRLTLNGCLEFRAYQKGFIPVTGVDTSRFGKFWDEDDSRANWIDFFDSRETSYWWYVKIHAECRIYRNWHLFFRDELLYFRSRQKEAIVFPTSYNYNNQDFNYVGTVVRYKPSTHFYAAGIRYLFLRRVSGEVSIGNKLINIWGLYNYPYSQWGRRFIASDRPYGEVRIRWNF